MTLLIFNTLGPEGMKYKTAEILMENEGSCQAVGSWRQHEDIEPNRVKPENGVPGENHLLRSLSKASKHSYSLTDMQSCPQSDSKLSFRSPTFLY